MKETLKKISSILGVAGTATAVFESVHHFSDLLNDQFWTVLSIAYLLVIIPLWPQAKTRSIGYTKQEDKVYFFSKFRWILLVTLLFGFAITYRLYKIYHPSEGPYPDVLPIPPNTKEQKDVTPYNINAYKEPNNNPVLALPDTNKKPKTVSKDSPLLLKFGLNTTKTTFIETSMSLGGLIGPKDYRTFILDKEYFRKKPDQCLCNWDTYAYDNVIIALKNYTKKTNKQGLDKYFDDFVKIEFLISQHPDIAQQLIPKNEEWSELSDTDRSEILRWARCCIGIPYPTFICSIQNRADEEIVVKEIHYNVYDTDQIRPNENGPNIPLVSYVYNLQYKTGTQVMELMPAGFKIPAKTSSAFELQLFTDHPDVGLCWLMNVEFVTTKGNIKTENFQLIMSGKPRWGKGMKK